MSPDDEVPLPGTRGKLEGVDFAEISALYDKEMPRLVLFIKTLSNSLDDHAAADIAHTAFERALPRWSTLRHPKSWLYTVAQNEVKSRSRALQRELVTDAIPEQAGELSNALTAEWRAEQRAVAATLKILAPQQQQVMAWTLADFTDAEIADALGMTADAVRQSRHKAKRNLQRSLGSKGRNAQ
jgi:RNA polymerase sigma-70 factor (ECF subfamily)